jgi:hypothetical protein
MSEQVYNKVQLGRESTPGTSVAATTVFPVDTGFLGFELDRASESPDEDFGNSDREQTGRESTGTRGADASLPFVGRFQDFMHVLEMHAAGSVAPTLPHPSTDLYTFDSTADTLKHYTLEYGDINSTQDEWEAAGVICNELDFGFDALSAPGNAMWTGSLGLLALDRVPAGMTAAQTPPATLETMEGHTTIISEGATGTAFASLSALTLSLKQFRFTSTLNKARRFYGGTTDKAATYGQASKGEVTYEALVKVSSTSKTDILDIFEVAGSVPTERRWRISVDGSGDNLMHIDFRTRFRAVNLGDHEGERLYLVNGVWVRDATLGGRGQFTLINAIASVP